MGRNVIMPTRTKKKVAKKSGKNIRVSEDGWEILRKYCVSKGYVLGTFVENCAISKVPLAFRENFYNE